MKNKNEIIITVTGSAGSGKSGICSTIERVLKTYGINVENFDPNPIGDRILKILDTIEKRKTIVKIVSVQILEE